MAQTYSNSHCYGGSPKNTCIWKAEGCDSLFFDYYVTSFSNSCRFSYGDSFDHRTRNYVFEGKGNEEYSDMHEFVKGLQTDKDKCPMTCKLLATCSS